MHPSSPLITADEGRPTPDSSHALVHFVAAAVCDGMSESRSRIHGRGHVACNEHGAVHGRRENGARAGVCRLCGVSRIAIWDEPLLTSEPGHLGTDLT